MGVPEVGQAQGRQANPGDWTPPSITNTQCSPKHYKLQNQTGLEWAYIKQSPC